MTQFYAGLDVSLEMTSICVVDEGGHICLETKVASDPTSLAQSLVARPQGVVVRASGSIAGRAPVRGHHRPASNGGLISPAMPELMLALASYTTSWGTTRGLSQLRRQ